MKTRVTLVALLLLVGLLSAGCRAIHINSLEKRIDSLETRVSVLEAKAEMQGK